MTKENDEKTNLKPEEHLDEFSALLIHNKLQSLEKDKRFAPQGIKYLGCRDDKYKIQKISLSYTGAGNYINDKYSYNLSRDFFERIVNDKRVSHTTIDYVLNEDGGVWFLGFPYIIHECYKKNTKESLNLMERVINLSLKNNKEAFNHTEERAGKLVTHAPQWLNRYGVVLILEETIVLALERADYGTAERFNKINKDIVEKSKKEISCYIATSYDFKKARTNNDPSLSEIEKHIQNSIHNGILNVDELVPISKYTDEKTKQTKETKNDFVAKYMEELIKAIKKYPITYAELIDDLISNEQWDKLRKLRPYDKSQLSQNTIKSFYICINNAYRKKDKKYAKEIFDQYFKNNGLLDPHIEARVDSYIRFDYRRVNSLAESSRLAKEQVIGNIRLKYQMYDKTGELTSDYFHELMRENRVRDIIIDLCVRLETILRNKYKYEGTLMDMLKKLCSGQYGTHDTEWKHLSKLIRCRNNIVHRNNTEEMMKTDELEWCINYICNIL